MTGPLRLLLASASPARLATLRSAGVDPLVRVSGVDEDAAVRDAESRYGPLEPADVALDLARAKAEAVAAAITAEAGERTHDSMAGAGAGAGAVGGLAADLVVGCDSVLEFDGRAHGKPASPQEAVDRWRAMSGATGVLHSGHWLIDLRPPDEGGSAATLGATGSTVVHFGRLSDAEIDAYVATGEPLHVAGAFTVDGLGGPYIDAIEGDFHNVVGISLPLLRGLLAQIGLPWHALTGS